MFFWKKEKPLYELTSFDTIARYLYINDKSYIIDGVKQYASKTVISLLIGSKDEGGFIQSKAQSITVPYSAENHLAPFEFDGLSFLWDSRDNALRYRPEVDWTKKFEINKYFYIIDDNIAWAEKNYAERNLSDLCLSYSYTDEDGNYCWSKIDQTSVTVFMELYRLMAELKNVTDPDEIGIGFDEVFGYATTYTPHYADYYFSEFVLKSKDSAGQGALMSLYCVKDFFYRELFEPEN